MQDGEGTRGNALRGRRFQPALVWHEEWSQMVALALPHTFSQASTPDSDQPPSILRNQANAQHRLTGGSMVTWGLAISRSPLKFFFLFFFSSRQPGEHFSFWEAEGRLKKKQTNKKKQSSGTSQISVTLHRSLQAPIPKCTGLSVCQAAWACQRTAAWPLPAPGHVASV